MISVDMYDAGQLLLQQLMNLPVLPLTHTSALDKYFATLQPSSTTPAQMFHSHLLSLHSTLIALLLSLSRPTTLITSIQTADKNYRKTLDSLIRASSGAGAFSIFGLLDDTRQRMDKDKEEKLKKMDAEKDSLSRELRYSYQTVAGELAGWQEWRGREVKRGIKEFVKGMVILERERGEGMRRAMRSLNLTKNSKARGPPPELPPRDAVVGGTHEMEQEEEEEEEELAPEPFTDLNSEPDDELELHSDLES